MNKGEKLQFQRSIENYFEEKHIYDLFGKLLKELVVNKPKDPIEYLIKRLKTDDISRVFITGSSGSDRKEVSLSIADDLGFACVSVGDLIVKEMDKKLESGRRIEKKLDTLSLIDDDIVIDLLRKELVRLEKENKSYIVEGFPKNRV